MNRLLRALVLPVTSVVLVGGLLVSGPATAAQKPGFRPGPVKLSTSRVHENAAPGTTVGVLSAKDRTARHVLRFSLVSGAGDRDNGRFAINGDRLQVAGPLDFETTPRLAVRVRVTDARGHRRETALTVAVGDVNEAPTGIQLSPASVVENSSGAVVGTLSASDPDLGDRHAFALVPGAGGEDNGSFLIWRGQVMTATPLDFESQQSYSIRVRATDAAGATYEQALGVSAVDVDETPANRAPTAVTIDNDEIAEETRGPVGVLSAVDPDAGDTHTFTVVHAEDGLHTDVTSRFTVVSGNVLQADGRCGGLDAVTYYVTVEAQDAGGLSVQTVIAVDVVPAGRPGARRC